MRTDSFANLHVLPYKPTPYPSLKGRAFFCLAPDVLAYRQQQFRYHVPVDTPESFVFIERARTAGEGVMVEHLFIEVFEFLRQVIRIAEAGIEMDSTVAVLLEYRTDIFLHYRQVLGLFRQVIEFQESLTTSVRVQHITALILAVEIGSTHGIQQVCGLFATENSGREHRHLSF